MSTLFPDYTPVWETEDHRLLRAHAANFLTKEATPHQERWADQHHVDRDFWTKAGAAGLLCLDISEEYGGSGGDFGHEAVIAHEKAMAHDTAFGHEVHSTIAIAALASGAIESYTARRRVRTASDVDVWTCVKTFDVDGVPVAVGLALEADEPRPADMVDAELSDADDGVGSIVAVADRPGRASVFSTLDGLSPRERAIVAALMQGK